MRDAESAVSGADGKDAVIGAERSEGAFALFPGKGMFAAAGKIRHHFQRVFSFLPFRLIGNFFSVHEQPVRPGGRHFPFPFIFEQRERKMIRLMAELILQNKVFHDLSPNACVRQADAASYSYFYVYR